MALSWFQLEIKRAINVCCTGKAGLGAKYSALRLIRAAGTEARSKTEGQSEERDTEDSAAGRKRETCRIFRRQVWRLYACCAASSSAHRLKGASK